MKRKRKNPIPILLLWSKKEQMRFIDAVEKLVSTARDLAAQVDELRAERQASQRKYERRKQSRQEMEAAAELAGAQAATDIVNADRDAAKGGGS